MNNFPQQIGGDKISEANMFSARTNVFSGRKNLQESESDDNIPSEANQTPGTPYIIPQTAEKQVIDIERNNQVITPVKFQGVDNEDESDTHEDPFVNPDQNDAAQNNDGLQDNLKSRESVCSSKNSKGTEPDQGATLDGKQVKDSTKIQVIEEHSNVEISTVFAQDRKSLTDQKLIGVNASPPNDLSPENVITQIADIHEQNQLSSDDKLKTAESNFDDKQISSKRTKFSQIFFMVIGVAFLFGVILTAVRFSSVKDYNTMEIRDAVNLAAPPLIQMPDQAEFMARANVMNDLRKSMIAPPPLSSYGEKTLIHISTDKPFYQPNDVVFIEAFLIDSISKKPIFARQDTIYPQLMYERASYLDVQATATIYDSFDKEVTKYQPAKLYNGTVVFNSWRIPRNQKGGEYKIKVESYYMSIPPSYRKIRVGQIQSPSLFVTFDFEKNAYSPGDEVKAKIKVRKPDGNRLPSGSSVAFSVGGLSINQDRIKLNSQGEVEIKFNLPGSVSQSVITVSLRTYLGFSEEDKSASITISSHSVPMLDDKFNTVFYPEFTNDLVKDVPNKMYFQVVSKPKTKEAKMSHIEFHHAFLVENSQIIVKDIIHIHNGRGFFTFKPKKGNFYSLFVKKSKADVTPEEFKLPIVNENLKMIALIVKSVVSFTDKTLDVNLLTTDAFEKGQVQVTVSNKENRLITKDVKFDKGGAQQKTVSIDLQFIYKDSPNGGAFILKVSSKSKEDKIERLIFLNPMESIDVSVETELPGYEPGDKVDLKISANVPQTLNEKQIVYASIKVSDLSSFLKVETYKQPPNLQSMVYLEKEVQHQNKELDEFYYSDEYLSFQPKGDDQHLDALLATQTWRRYQFDDVEGIKEKINQAKGDAKNQYEYLLGEKGYQIRFSRFKNAVAEDNQRFQPMAMQRGGAQIAEAAMAGPKVEMEVDEMAIIPKMQKDQAGDDEDENDMAGDVAGDIAPQKKRLPKEDIQKIIDSRRYVHQRKVAYTETGPRTDFTQTLLFNSAIEMEKASESLRQASQSFYLNDQVSQFQITVNVFTSDGKYGYVKKLLSANKLVYSHFTLPNTFVADDILNIPIRIQNNVLDDVKLTAFIYDNRDGKVFKTTQKEVSLQAIRFTSINYPLETKTLDLYSNITLRVVLVSANGKVYDSLEKNSSIILNGFQETKSFSNILGVAVGGKQSDALLSELENTITLPATIIGEPTFNLKLFTSTFDNILDAIKSLIRNPSGCFEQTSSTTYPMVMALELLHELKKQYSARDDEKTLENINKMIAEIEEKLKDGYNRLISFETPSKGFEWFGAAPGHEALSSYGFKQFLDMKKTTNYVDDDMIKRTQNWILSRRNGKGKFDLNPRALDTFGKASQDITDAYILWVLTSTKEYNEKDLQSEFNNLKNIALNSYDPYILGLASGAFLNVGQMDLAKQYAQRIVSMQNQTSGAVQGAKTSITSSRGNNLLAETTSLAMMDWIDIDAASFSPQIELAIKFLMGSVKNGGSYGSTQATVLSLQALVKYAKKFGGLKGKGKFILSIEGKQVSTFNFDQADSNINSVDFSYEVNQFYKSQTPKPTSLKVQLAIADYQYNSEKQGFQVSYLFEADYINKSPVTDSEAPIKFTVSYDEPLSQISSKIGAVQTQKVFIENLSGAPQGMSVTMLSIPSCMTVELSQLELLKNKGDIDNYEMSSDSTLLTLYWTYMKHPEYKIVKISRVVSFTGSKCQERAQKAFLYYDDNLVWAI